ncbi:VCBS repeat-containing protein [Streptomyces sp. NBC_01381]|uniref:FG-GAP repeat domain-containing protein n=1 Tax=Streptomyces sp. NBC_01381 TaxID=2903845 RepID=UPI0022599877|nr:VCBS repeat-containing protein [Streptomyces sp. NBC_01381]MCX4665612.1 VCBS repeat-containing protein [Streptomyces sp. NBC_01381]
MNPPSGKDSWTSIARVGAITGLTVCCTAAALAGCGVFGGETKRFGRPPAGEAAKNPSPKDFNGDGYDDYATVLKSGRTDDGRVERSTYTLTVVYGSPEGLRPDWSTRLPAGDDDVKFGRLLRTDLDNDGFTDLVSSRDAGPGDPVFVMFGGARGLSGAERLDAGHLPPVAAGDFDGDGATDLFDGEQTLFGPFDRKKRQPARATRVDKPNPASLDVVTGDFEGDGRTDVVMTNAYHGDDYEQNDDPPEAPDQAVYFRGGAKGLARDEGPQAELVSSMSTYDGPRGGGAGDVDGDGIDDFVANGEATGSGSMLTVIHGSRAGLGGDRPAEVLEGRGSTWGSGPMVGDVDGDRRADLVAGRPGFHIIDPDKILLLRGGPHGPSTERAQTVTGGDEGLPDGIAPHQLQELDLLDVDGDGRQDVVVFSQRWKKEQGYFLVLGGTGDGLETEGIQHFTADDVGVQLWGE